MKLNPGSFTSIYNICKLVYFEEFMYVDDAIKREKQIKGGSRKKKIELIEKSNKDWADSFLVCNIYCEARSAEAISFYTH